MKQSFYVCLYFILVFTSCENNQEHPSENSDTVSQNFRREKYFSGKPDLPISENEITSAGIGNVMLGDSLGKLKSLFQNTQRLIQDFEVEEEGKAWPAKKIIVDGKYIIAEALNTIDLISVLKTNMPNIKTRNGVFCGLHLDSLENLKDSLKFNFEHKTLTYGNTGVWFKIDKASLNKFFGRSVPDYNSLKNSKVEEFIIVCGDC